MPAGIAARGKSDRVKRGALLAAIVAGHLLILLWLLMAPATVPFVKHRRSSLSVIAMSDGQQAATPPAVPKKVATAPRPPPLIVLPSTALNPADVQVAVAAAASASRTGDPGGCALASRATLAIVSDPVAMAELAALPAPYRTSADAVLLWNGQWVAGGLGTVAPPVAPELRHVVEQVVADAAPECRDAPVAGPQFMAIPEQGRTTTLVVGSGVWRWSDLLAQCGPAAVDSCTDADLSPPTDQLF